MDKKKFVRGAGILLPVSSLPSPYGIGTLGEAAYQFVKLLVDLRQKYWQVLPLGPCGYGDSPYQPVSSMAGNPLFIDLDLLIKEGLLEPGEVQSVNWGGRRDEADYDVLYQNRYRVLREAYRRFMNSVDPDYEAFAEDNDRWLGDYSFFMAAKTFSGDRPWVEWDEKLRDREPEAMNRYSEKLSDEIGFWKFCQYEFFRQWNALKAYANARGVRLIGEIPFYIAHDSSDVWANKELFLLNRKGYPKETAGFPPDAFYKNGQDWGCPVYDFDRMQEDDFAWWRDRTETNAGRYDGLIINHFLGMVRYCSIPYGEENRKAGRWNKGPGKKLADVIAGAAGDCGLIAEDLKAAVPGVRKLRQRTGWPGMRILQYAFDGDTSNEHLPHNFQDSCCVLYAGNHDNDTIAGFYGDKTEYELAYLYEYLNISSKEEIPDAFLRLAYSSIADIVIFQMQDILKLGSEARMNRPATTGENWRWRMWDDSLIEKKRAWIRTMAAIYRR